MHHGLQGHFGLCFVEGVCNARVRRVYGRRVGESEADAASLSFVHKPRLGRLHGDGKADIASHVLGLLSVCRELRVEERDAVAGHQRTGNGNGLPPGIPG
jgi:hypothetical protein